MCTHIPPITHTYKSTPYTQTYIVVVTVTYNAYVEVCNKIQIVNSVRSHLFLLPCVGYFIYLEYTPGVALDRLNARSYWYSLSCIVWITKNEYLYINLSNLPTICASSFNSVGNNLKQNHLSPILWIIKRIYFSNRRDINSITQRLYPN